MQARKESGSELGAPWVPPPAGPWPHPFGFSHAVDLQLHHQNPEWDPGKVQKKKPCQWEVTSGGKFA